MNRSKAYSPYMGIALTTLSVIVFEISLTKIFSVTLWYHFAYLVVSLALFGLGAGGLAAYFLQGRLRSGGRTLTALALAQAASIVLCLAFLANCDIRVGLTLKEIAGLAITYVVCSCPFVVAGMNIAMVLRLHSHDAAKLYAADLIGSAAGCLVFLAAISFLSGPTVVLVSAVLALAAAGAYCRPFWRSIPTARLAAVATIAVAVLGTNLATDFFRIKYTKKYHENGGCAYEKWSPLARITVYPSVYFSETEDSPFGWGMSEQFKPKEPIEQFWIEQDACAGTPITRFDGDLSKLEFLKYDVTSMPYYVVDDPEVFIIGAGGGRDVLTALVFDSPQIVACDINPVIVNLVKEEYRDFAGDLYRHPRVQTAVAEARSYIRGSDRKFDLIQISLIDSWAATTAGAFSLAENNLYTVEAFADYFEHLSDDGMLSVSRFLFTPRNQSLRVVTVARRALENLGVEHPESHVAVIGTSKDEGVATVLAKRTPFSTQEARRIIEAADHLGFEVLYLPGQQDDRDADFAAALTATPLESYTDASFFDLSPATDDRPFFFQMVPFSKAFRAFFGEKLVGQWFNYYAPGVLLALAAISAVLIGLFYIVPLAVSRKVEGLPKPWGLYFILLGRGFMFVEIPLLQKGSLYLGHPTYSLSIVLFSMLVFTGIGSYLSSRIAEANLGRTLARCLLLSGLLVVLITFCLEWVVPATIGLPLAVKIAIMVFFTGSVALLMGTAFPSGIRLLGRKHENAIPWVWALNGGASVFGSIVSMAIAMSTGYRITLLAGAGIYLLAAVVVWQLIRSYGAADAQPIKSVVPRPKGLLRPRRQQQATRN